MKLQLTIEEARSIQLALKSQKDRLTDDIEKAEKERGGSEFIKKIVEEEIEKILKLECYIETKLEKEYSK